MVADSVMIVEGAVADCCFAVAAAKQLPSTTKRGNGEGFYEDTKLS